MTKYIFKLIAILSPLFLFTTSCDMEVYPVDGMTEAQIAGSIQGAKSATLGNYSMLKDAVKYQDISSNGNTYIRHFTQMAEFPGDNATLSGRTEDPLFEIATYMHSPTLSNVAYFWWISYKIIYGANVVIESVPEGVSADQNELKGENYFLRAMVHFDLSRLFSRPYSQGRDNLGVVLRTSSTIKETHRATVGEVYDKIVEDLENAARLMTKRGKDKGYASREAAYALLSRVYLYMGENDKAIQAANNVFDIRPITNMETTANFPNYFANALASTETLFAVAHATVDSKAQASIASMYLHDGIGWGEVYASFPYLKLLGRNDNDVRHKFIVPQYEDENVKAIYYEVYSALDNRYYEAKFEVKYNTVTQKYEYTDDNNTKRSVDRDAYGNYSIMLNGQKQTVLLTSLMKEREGYSKYYVNKFSYQDGDPMLSSPVFLRLAEVVLNRAEAYAKKGDAQSLKNALDDVNVIRKRAGLSGNALFSTSNMQGYASVLDVVLDERRLELAFEGHRTFDVYRNNLAMDRRFPGIQPGVVIQPTNARVILYIPQAEISSSKIQQND